MRVARCSLPLLLLALSACGARGCSAEQPLQEAKQPLQEAKEPAKESPPPLPAPRPSSAWWNGAVFYEVFVRSFQDANGDGKGDIAGLISRLDYLNDGDPATAGDLGVDALWLMPVFESPSYHGYDVTNYERINPDYGSLSDFDRLLVEAHKRGLRVIVDLVVNHTSVTHPWFVDATSSPAASHRDWYVWSNTKLGWKQPFGAGAPTWHERGGAYYYGLFWEGMPDLNLRTKAVREEIARIAGLWLQRGVDGFRLDAARFLVEHNEVPALQADAPETHAFWKEFAAHVRSLRQDAALVGECWADTSTIASYYGSSALVPGGDELPMSFNFPLAESIIGGIKAGDGARIARTLAEMKESYPPGATDAPFLSNHDRPRVGSQMNKVEGRLRSAAAVLLTLPGSPFVYYGEEVGMASGTTGNDEAFRTPMPWNAEKRGGFTAGAPWQPLAPGRETENVAREAADPGSLLSRYRALIRVRKASAALGRGAIEVLTPTSGPVPTLAFLRTEGAERVLVIHNLSDSGAVGGPYPVESASPTVLFADPKVGALERASGGARVALPPYGTGIWRL
jgi:glycosidase